MGVYLEAVYKRLRLETTGEASCGSLEQKWLLAMLQENGWWISASKARAVCFKLGLVCNELSYYRDIYVWLPDLRWGQEGVPPCVECKKSDHVGVHGYHKKHHG